MNLLRFAIERTYRGVDPAPMITAPKRHLRVVTAEHFENRDRYIRQSEETRDGEVAELPSKPS